MNREAQAQKWFLKTALSYLGTPYIWGGDDPSGFDCSGFVVECLKTAGLIGEKEDYTADGLMHHLSSNVINRPCEFRSAPRRGALLFTINRNGKATHVAICLDDYFQIGAGGGTKNTVDPKAAWRDNAYVKIRPIIFLSPRVRVVDPFQD